MAMVALANIEILNGCQNEKFISTYFGNIKFVQLFYTSQTFADNMRINVMRVFSRGGTRVHSQLPNECNYLPRVLEFMAIIFVIIEISSALWTQKI